jgi:thioredoxin 1
MKMNKPLHITDNEFQNKVLDASIPVVVDFWAPWCGPCKFIAPILDKIAADFDDKVLIAKVNTDENPEWATKLGVQGIPTLLFVSQGDIKSRLVGAAPAQQIIAKINELLPVTTG